MRLDTDWRRHPRIRPLGWFGATVLLQVWIVAKQLGRRGFVPSAYLEPEFLADEIGCDPGKTAGMIIEAIAKARRRGLLEPAEDGVFVRDWRQYQIDSSTERVRRHRSRKRDSDGLDTDETVTKRNETDVTDETSAVVYCPVSVSDPSPPRSPNHRKDPTKTLGDRIEGRGTENHECIIRAGEVLQGHLQALGRAFDDSPARLHLVSLAIREAESWPAEKLAGRAPADAVALTLRWTREANRDDHGNTYTTTVERNMLCGIAREDTADLSRFSNNFEAAKKWNGGATTDGGCGLGGMIDFNEAWRKRERES